MLKPEKNRLDYGELLSPPEGYKLDRAVGTTYSLDIETLISIPVALAFAQTLDSNSSRDRLHILEGISKCSKNIQIYCQRGQILVP